MEQSAFLVSKNDGIKSKDMKFHKNNFGKNNFKSKQLKSLLTYRSFRGTYREFYMKWT